MGTLKLHFFITLLRDMILATLNTILASKYWLGWYQIILQLMIALHMSRCSLIIWICHSYECWLGIRLGVLH